MRAFTLRLLGACGVLASSLASQQPAGRHTITHEDVFLMKRVSSPAISPDGRWIVFSVTEPSYSDGDQVSDLWLVPTDGSAEPRRLTNTKGGEGGVDWSGDSRRIAFSARREGDDQSQIYVLDLTGGGEAQRVTNLSTALMMVETGRILDAKESHAAGLVDELVDDGQALPAALEYAKKLAAGPSVAVDIARRCVHKALTSTLEEMLDYEAVAATMSAHTEDAAEGTKAFVEKRKPVFRGR